MESKEYNLPHINRLSPLTVDGDVGLLGAVKVYSSSVQSWSCNGTESQDKNSNKRTLHLLKCARKAY